MPPIGNSLCDQLRLQEPVSINGPFPSLMRTADVGDLIQLQIFSVPGIGPDPTSVRVYSDCGNVAFLEAVTTGGAIYHPNPGEVVTGVLGTINYSVFVQVVRPGNDNVTVEVRLADGSRKCVPFAFMIS
jgi:hypothetical protein